MPSSQEQKKQLRKRMETIRQSLTEAQRKSASEAICRFTLAACQARMSDIAPPTLFTYIPFRSEVDVRPLIAWSWQQGYRIVVPRVQKADRFMHLHILSGFDDLEPGAWGIEEPRSATPMLESMASIDVVIVPGLAFDRKGGRLGYGSGFYDRFLRAYDDQGLSHPFTIGVGYHVQLLDDLPMESHDLRVDQVITEKGACHMNDMKSS